ncbi:MAG TPA: hypothetical protein VG055_33830 [Planctomycetaceae bacterium]|jgi:hypothetical protein|nr:hypothetical protein [Planctomycetaceae bacterium]
MKSRARKYVLIAIVALDVLLILWAAIGAIQSQAQHRALVRRLLESDAEVVEAPMPIANFRRE